MAKTGKVKVRKSDGGLDESKPLFAQLSVQVDVEKAFGVSFDRYRNLNVYCPFCEREQLSKSPSCSVNVDGIFTCKSCGRSGSATTFYAQKKRVPIQQAKGDLKLTEEQAAKWAERHLRKEVPPITDDLVKRCHQKLMRSTFDMSYLTGKRRGLKVETLVEYEIGCDEWRITIPIRVRDGALWGIRRYHAGKKPKMVSHAGGQGSPYLYPAWKMDQFCTSNEPYLVLCEGEWDCLLLNQNGFEALTLTSGVKSWSEEFTLELLTVAKPIVIIYDVNDEEDDQGVADLGQRVALERACLLRDAGLTVKVVKLPLKYSGGDITDWFTRAGRNAEELRQLIDDTPLFDGVPSEDDNHKPTGAGTGNGQLHDPLTPPTRPVGRPRSSKTKRVAPDGSTQQMAPNKPRKRVVEDVPPTVQRNEDAPWVTLHEASKSKYLYKSIRLRCLVAGRIGSPYLLPTKVEATIYQEDAEPRVVTKAIDPWDGRILSLIKCTSIQQTRMLRAMMGIDPKDKATVNVVESLNVEEIFLIPTIDHESNQGPYVMRECYYVGHGLNTNQVYDFEGYTLPDPRTQSATHILTAAKPAATDLQNFTLSKEQYKQLKQTFQTKDLFGKLEAIAEEFATHVTQVRGRPDLHMAIDLVFHSPLAFDFDGTKVRKGWLECLILGDTRTGKGFVAEGLIKHYGVGEVVSAEMVSMAGLVGGIQSVGDRSVLCWGKIPLANERLLVIDEASNLTYENIGRLSRIRSEGVVEITKILTEKTSAKTRLIWLSNPRPPFMGKPKKMLDFTFGIEAVPELIGNAEDVARFDYVLTVAHGEVKSSLINQKKNTPTGGSKLYTSELCRKLIVWIWSRKSEHIVFDEGVIEYTMVAAQDLGKQFSPSICLIQAEDVRFKLARIACAAAGRTFSTEDGEHLIVRKEHVDFAYNFLHHIYSKSSCGYAQLSLAERERSTLRDPQAVLVCLQQVGDLLPDLVSGMLEQQQISARDMCDYAGVDIYEARSIISELVRLRAITKDNHFYRKKPAFKAFLQKLKQNLQVDPHHVTVDDDEADNTPLEGDTDA